MTPAQYTTLSDGELLELSVEDPDAFGAFYDRFEEELLAFFMRATQRAELAADLTAEVFAAALASAGLFRAELGSAPRPAGGCSGSRDTSSPTPGSVAASRIARGDAWASSRSA